MATTDTDGTPASTLPAGVWRVEPTSSELGFRARGVFGLVPVKGTFGDYEGELHVDDTGARGELRIRAASLNTGNGTRDTHLRSADFFHVENHPEFTFAVDDVTLTDRSVRVNGRLTVRGNTRPASFDATVSRADGEVSLDGELPVDRTDFGLTWNFMGIASVRNTIVVHAVFTRA